MRLKTFGGLWIENPGAWPGAGFGGLRPRPLALLAILAADAPKGTSRDRALGILWPDSDPERARHTLSQALYSLKRNLGANVVLAAPELRLDSTVISSDLEELRAAVASKEWEKAAGVYTGPFLWGFYLSDAPEFERWAEEQRAVLATTGMRAIEKFAQECTQRGRQEEAVEQFRRLIQLDPLSSRYAVSYMEGLAALGDRATALAHGKSHSELVRQELEAAPDGAVLQLMSRLREAERVSAPARVVAAPDADVRSVVPPPRAATPISIPADLPVARPSPAASRRRAWAAVGLAAAAVLAVFGWRAIRAVRADPRPILAVGRIRDLVAPDSAALSGVLSEMLATSLGRVTDLQVIANSRILEITPREADTSRTALTDAARRAGATEVIEGELSPLGDRQLRLEIRRVDMARGLVRGAYRLEGSDRIGLFDSVTALIAADLRLGAPARSLADVSTRSPIAYRLYEEGLRAFFQFDALAANRLFRAALKEDSTFAMATYYAWRSEVAIGGPRQNALADRAVALASRASDRDRLLILAHVGLSRSDMRAVSAADSLSARFAADPEALIRAAEVTDDLARAVTLLDHAITLDSAAASVPLAVCRSCDALDALARRYDWADSTAAVERTFRRWNRLRPDDYTPWLGLADYLVGLGRSGDAAIALGRADSLGAPEDESDERRLTRALRADDPAAANEICHAHLRPTEREEFLHYRSLCAIALRIQGRYRDALALVRTGRAPGSITVHRALPRDRVHEIILDLEMGRGRVAAADLMRQASEAASDSTLSPGMAAGRVAWHLTLAGMALAAVGDTIAVRSLVDSVEVMGVRSLNPRDPLLHHFLRGTLLSGAGEHEGAVRAFRAAISSPSHGFTRINLELGNSLVAANRPAEAIPMLRAALHGGFGESELYVTRTALHEALARAFDAAGQPDSAAAHFITVARAWRDADPSLAPQRDSVRRRLAAHGRAPR